MAVTQKGSTFFPVFFLLVGFVFVAILGFAYYGTRQANPVMLDEQGHAKGAH